MTTLKNMLLRLLSYLLLWFAVQDGARAEEEEERLVGWRGETWNSASGRSLDPEAHGKAQAQEPWIETISWQPRAFVYHNFLSEAECDHLVNLGTKRVSRSSVVDAKTGQTRLDEIRTSYGGSFGRGEDPIIATVEAKIAEWTHIPPDHGEPLQILRYMNGQQYGAHWDWFSDPQYFGHGDNRLATVLLYLSEVEEGGETALPLAQAIDAKAQQIDNPSACAARMGLAVRPRKGDALLFFDLDLTGTTGQRSALHASCPTLKGTKWTATKWIHNHRHMGSYDALARAMSCQDVDNEASCLQRAAAGECKSKDGMIGAAGVCRKTCKDCIVCENDDILCGRSNMRGRLNRNGA